MAPGSPVPGRGIPTYTIDLASPPQLRYVQLAQDMGERMRDLRKVFDEVLGLLCPSAILRKTLKLFARASLYRLHDGEETQELKGIARTAGVELWLLVVFNTLLDYLLGCTSGAVRVKPTKMAGRGEGGTPTNPIRLMHFRTLDWGMDQLRDLLVVLEFVNSSSGTPTRILARSITYAGFVGTLTAVRENMSLSMNFRPNHTCSTTSLRYHQLLTLLGRRRSLPSVLRSFILDGLSPRKETRSRRTKTPPASQPQSLKGRARQLASVTCAPCYVILCDGTEVVAIEKDLFTGGIRSSADFLVHTNHDVQEADSSDPDVIPGVTMSTNSAPLLAYEQWLEDSTNRMDAVANKWRQHVQRRYPAWAEARGVSTRGGSPNRPSQDDDDDGDDVRNEDTAAGDSPCISQTTLKKWLQAEPVFNPCTHFGCILDPKMGEIRWLEGIDWLDQ